MVVPVHSVVMRALHGSALRGELAGPSWCPPGNCTAAFTTHLKQRDIDAGCPDSACPRRRAALISRVLGLEGGLDDLDVNMWVCPDRPWNVPTLVHPGRFTLQCIAAAGAAAELVPHMSGLESTTPTWMSAQVT